VAAGDDTRFLAGTGYNAGNLTGAVTLNALNGLVQRGTLTGDVGLSNITGQPAASTFTLIVAASGADRLLTLAASMIDLRDGQGSKALTVRNGQTLVLEMAYSGLNWYYATSAPAEVVFRPMDNEPPASAFATIDLRNSHPVLDFDDTTAESAVFTGVMPTGYGSGPLSVILRWAATSATTGNVKWNVAFETMPTGVLDIDADDFAAVQTVTTAANATSGVMSRTTITFTNAQADAVAAGVAFRIKVTRDAADAADTMVGDAELVAVTVTEA
jgi:hypothetical protein